MVHDHVDLSEEEEMNMALRRRRRIAAAPRGIPRPPPMDESTDESPPPAVELDVAPLIAKLDEVIRVMKSFDIQTNLGNIYRVINQVAQRINFLQDAEKGYPKMLNMLNDVNTKLQNTNQGLRLLSD